MTVTVEYVSGLIATGQLDEWPSLPTEGVDRVIVRTPTGECHIANHSLYWSYQEGHASVFGAGSVRYDPNPLTEILIHPDGSQEERHPSYLPDLPLSAVKLGHWWVGTSAPIEGRPWR